MKWTEEEITIAIYRLMREIGIKRMPTSMEMREHKLSGLSRAIGLNGGTAHWAKKMNLPVKEKKVLWSDQRIEEEVRKCMKVLQIQRMPVASELTGIGRNDLHCALSKSKLKYSGWAKKLGVSLKSSETTKGNEYEGKVLKLIEVMGLDAKSMSTKHPYDLLVNDCVKIDVKVGTAHHHFGARAHTFALNKKYASCDIYVCVALDEQEKTESCFIIPARDVQIVTLNIGTNSKYNKYKDGWELIPKLVNHFDKAFGVSG
ncbi:hypothetical protein MKX72_20180 [Priestia sp. FSL R5-0597]|uniref:hypothetical protein n=1 Tax=Priestia sp. FSL R5-0597 TaxID=2921580 RepID=UPI0030F5BD69